SCSCATSHSLLHTLVLSLFSFTRPAPSQIYSLSLHDALPISVNLRITLDGINGQFPRFIAGFFPFIGSPAALQNPSQFNSKPVGDRKSTRLNSSHLGISYAVFCLKKKKQKNIKSLVLITDYRK